MFKEKILGCKIHWGMNFFQIKSVILVSAYTYLLDLREQCKFQILKISIRTIDKNLGKLFVK